MSSDLSTAPMLFFEGYLKKRKDKMKIRWATYWFRLHNTTLFFYNKKEGHASHLRGQYYIYMVQSVREVNESKRHTFEMTMKNGKRKVLAAETPDLRCQWVRQLWQAMQLSGSGRSLSVCAWPRASQHEQKPRVVSTPPCPSNRLDPDLMENTAQPSSPPEPESVALPDSDLYSVPRTTEKNIIPTDTPIYCNVYQYTQVNKLASDQSQDQKQKPEENLYDVLPPTRKSHTEATESIYDVPKSLLRKMPEHTLESQAAGDQLVAAYSITPLR
ncbi:uncharacterized protein LOC134459664 [Engraulis encrasicolus]|uniref:uncharacterized protein LOC134459664 n=1 Tax=Engraulis encrasicolus TaxID=184585 RepID=UPI002FD4137C